MYYCTLVFDRVEVNEPIRNSYITTIIFHLVFNIVSIHTELHQLIIDTKTADKITEGLFRTL